jgi:hypothetical protein
LIFGVIIDGLESVIDLLLCDASLAKFGSDDAL